MNPVVTNDLGNPKADAVAIVMEVAMINRPPRRVQIGVDAVFGAVSQLQVLDGDSGDSIVDPTEECSVQIAVTRPAGAVDNGAVLADELLATLREVVAVRGVHTGGQGEDRTGGIGVDQRLAAGRC